MFLKCPDDDIHFFLRKTDIFIFSAFGNGHQEREHLLFGKTAAFKNEHLQKIQFGFIDMCNIGVV